MSESPEVANEDEYELPFVPPYEIPFMEWRGRLVQSEWLVMMAKRDAEIELVRSRQVVYRRPLEPWVATLPPAEGINRDIDDFMRRMPPWSEFNQTYPPHPCATGYNVRNSNIHHRFGPGDAYPDMPDWTPWAQLQRAHTAQIAEIDADIIVEKKVRGILNKFTVEKFDKLYADLTDLITTESQVNKLVELIFDKAIQQHHFIGMYTDMCQKLNEWTKEKSIVSGDMAFRKILIDSCQSYFAKTVGTPLDTEKLKDLSEDDRIIAHTKHKTRMLGNVRFVAQLLQVKLLSWRIVPSVMNDLLRRKEEQAYECLVAFILPLGNVYEAHCEFQQQIGHNLHAVWADHWNQIAQASVDDSISIRVRSLLQDAVDMKSSGWKNSKTLKLDRTQSRQSARSPQPGLDRSQSHRTATPPPPATPTVDEDGFTMERRRDGTDGQGTGKGRGKKGESEYVFTIYKCFTVFIFFQT